MISTISGQHLAVMVTEPTPSGPHDLQRIEELCAHFGMPAAVVVNKRDLNEELSQAIRRFCEEKAQQIQAVCTRIIEYTHRTEEK